MRKIVISDATMKQTSEDFRLTFKEKIELSKLLDRLGVDVIELEGIKNPRIDALQIKSISLAVTDSTIAVPVALTEESVERTFAALKEAKHPRLQVAVPTSAVQIEYIFHMKPDALVAAVEKTVAACRALCPDVEFVAEDATRSEGDFLARIMEVAVNAGATTVTLCDTAGTMLPAEFAAFVAAQYEALPALRGVTLGIACADTIAMADACAVAAVGAGAGQLRVAAYPLDAASLRNVCRVLTAKGDALCACTGIRATQLDRIIDLFTRTCRPVKGQGAPLTADGDTDGVFLTVHDDITAVSAAVKRLGYDLTEEDTAKVFESFRQIAERKERVGLKELDAIVASSAMQVPATYRLDTYLITSGNTVSATAHIKLTKNGEPVEGVYIGDGSIDAAFQAIEKITGCHYELDDFQLQAVTEGREAMGETVVKLRAGGKVYSGRGISTDIVGAGIEAYLSALNKIVYEEEA
jgi:2-isopropylmalate synthase